MRCSCPECGTYMVHSESMHLGCVCPECGARCKMCLGTNTVISRDELRAKAKSFLEKRMDRQPEEENE